MVEVAAAFAQPHPAQPGAGILSWWISCFCVFAVLWLRVFCATASVIEVAAAPVLRWLVTLGLISWIVFILFLAVLSRPSWVRWVLRNRGLRPRFTRCLAGLPAPCAVAPASLLPAAPEAGELQPPWRKVGLCGGACVVGPGLRQRCLIPPSVPH